MENKRAFIYKNGKSSLRARAVMETKLNRKLTEDECVHHINGIVDDDRPENLEILSRREHTLKHRVGKKDVFVDTRTNEDRRDWIMRMWNNNGKRSEDDKIW